MGGLLVFGRNGQVATELLRRAPDTAPVIALGRDACDLTQAGTAAAAIAAHAPAAVINAAAWTAVDKAEDEEHAATRLNADAPGEMARACAAAGIPFLHVSTDYVFDGSGDRPWREDDATAPLGAYGRSKLAGEAAVAAAGGHWLILRTAWVFAGHGQNFVRTMLRLSESRDALNIVADQHGGPTPAGAIADALLHATGALQQGQAGGLYHFAGQPHVSWADFARVVFAAAERPVTVTDIPASAYPTPAARPGNSRLNCTAFERDFGIPAPDWRAALPGVIEELTA